METIDKDRCVQQVNSLPRTANGTVAEARVRVGNEGDAIEHVVIMPVEVECVGYYFTAMYEAYSEVPESERLEATKDFADAREAYDYIVARATAINNFFANLKNK